VEERVAPGGMTHEQASVLVVEDDPTLLSTLAYNLSREGYRVLTAGDGEAALVIARREIERLDLVLLDLMLPGISGLHVLQHLRRESNVPVLILSARGEEQDKVDGLELGADDYVVKPFALRELLARVRAGVRRRSTPAARPPVVLYRGPLRVELERRRVLVGDQEVSLRPKEYGLLTTLAMEPGRVFSRQDLLDTVWGEEVIVDERTVDVHISWLRGKLTAAGLNANVIGTVYGAGYHFVLGGDRSEATVVLADVGGGDARGTSGGESNERAGRETSGGTLHDDGGVEDT
jgi:DNA-binding response OmpR family regulator